MLQYKFLRTPNGCDWRYLSFNSEEDAETCHLADLKNVVVGRIMQDTPQFSCGEHSILVALLCFIDGLIERASVTSNSKRNLHVA